MPDNRDLIEALRNPRIHAEYERFRADPYAFPQQPNPPAGPELRNPPPRPNDALQAALAEQVSPTMGAYGFGALGAEAFQKAREGDYGGALGDASLLAAGAIMPGVKGVRGRFNLSMPSADHVPRQVRTPQGAISWSVEPDGKVFLHDLETRKAERGKGHAGRLLDEFLAEADQQGAPIELQATPLDAAGLDRQGLVRFYESRGFAPVTGSLWRMSRDAFRKSDQK